MENDVNNKCCEGYEYGAYKYLYPRVMLRSAPYLPHIYFNVISDEQRVKDMCMTIDDLYEQLAGLLTVEEFNAFLAQLEKDQEAQTQECHDYANKQDSILYASLLKIIEELQIGMLIWDVTRGIYGDNMQTMRNMFNDVTLYGVSVDTLAGLPLTVDSLSDSGLNVRGLATFGGYLAGADFVPEGINYAAPLDKGLTVKILASGKVDNGVFVEGE